MIDFLRTLKLPLVIFAIVASLWAYARAQSLGQQATQAYWPALTPMTSPARAPAAGQTLDAREKVPADEFDVELVEIEPAAAAPVTPADSSQTR